MRNSSRVILNTGAQYTKTIVNVILSLYSTRIILGALGVDDYGIYSLVAGVVALLSFIVNAMVVTTQRFISFNFGKGGNDTIKKIFATSISLHLIIGLLAGMLLEFVGIYLFNGYLNIVPEKIALAYHIYHVMVVILIITFLTSPFRALLIAHENIVYLSIIDVIDGLFKLLFALYLTYVTNDRLITYVSLLIILAAFNFIVLSIYDFWKYEECVFPTKTQFSYSYIRELSSFAGWTIYSVGCIAGRTQGVAVIINRFFGVTLNAAFGLALQVNGAFLFLSQSLMNALNPQIVKSEGSGNRQKMLRLSEIESKFAFFILSMVAIPCIFEMPTILTMWLKDVPANTVYFCDFIILASMVDQLTVGLGTANQATGKIMMYSLFVNTVKLSTVAVVGLLLLAGGGIYVVMPCYVAVELLCSVIRLFFLKRSAGLDIREFCSNVFLKEIIPVSLIIISCYIIVLFVSAWYRFLLTFLISGLVYSVSIYYFGLCTDEKGIVSGFINKLKK